MLSQPVPFPELKKAEAGCGRSQVSSSQACSSLYVYSTCIPMPEKYFKISQNTCIYRGRGKYRRY